MVKSELDMLQSFIDELSGTLSASPQDEEYLYDLLNRANALYGDYVPEIAAETLSSSTPTMLSPASSF